MIKRVKEVPAGLREIWLAGGCFWGTQAYLGNICGVEHTSVGYANGHTPDPDYEAVCTGLTGYAEAVHVIFDPAQLRLSFLLELYFQSVDPVSVNRQGGDVGDQYRTGIYYTEADDLPEIRAAVEALAKTLARPVAIEIAPLASYYPAEDWHQDYLRKNPRGYCHISPVKLAEVKTAREYPRPDGRALRLMLTPIQYAVTQESATEPPFQNPYHDHFEPGIYVDVTTGEPLFASADKFESGCGWPAFSKPIRRESLLWADDTTHNMLRTEVRSKSGDAHLGHVFDDGPPSAGGLRYCINSAALRFVPAGQMQAQGYGHLLPLIEK